MPSKLSFASHMQYNQSVRKTSTVNPLYGQHADKVIIEVHL